MNKEKDFGYGYKSYGLVSSFETDCKKNIRDDKLKKILEVIDLSTGMMNLTGYMHPALCNYVDNLQELDKPVIKIMYEIRVYNQNKIEIEIGKTTDCIKFDDNNFIQINLECANTHKSCMKVDFNDIIRELNEH